jgi:ATP-dependent helicase/nuclease subunit A
MSGTGLSSSPPGNVGAPPPPDQAARDRIRTALDANILVEAGAGAGKTTSLVDRLMAYVERGDPVESLAAVTFTRKAAAELRERFQVRLEARARETRARADAGDAEAAVAASRCETALASLDGALLGTIHSFCARLLRERPIAAGLDPSFEEVEDVAWQQLRDDFWRRWVEERVLADDPAVAELRALGVHPTELGGGFAEVITYPDVDFTAPPVPRPDVAAARAGLEKLLAEALKLLPDDEPADGWDPLQMRCRRLRYQRSRPSWGEDLGFLEALAELCGASTSVTQKRWSMDPTTKKAAGALKKDFDAFITGAGGALLAAWTEYRYPTVLRFLNAATGAFERERRRTGKLGFGDLLLGARDLLRDDADARRELGRRYAHLLVDEFQDTDPIQAEVCFLLAADPDSGGDWRTVELRPGALFVVGDPKQSIYRFRRASFDTYRAVKERFRKAGEVLELVACFRCAPAIAGFVEAHFRTSLPAEDADEQAKFAPITPWGAAAGVPGSVAHYAVTVAAKRAGRGTVLPADATQLASWIARRVADGTAPESFLVLTYRRADTALLARELGERNVPVSLTGGNLEERDELAELLVILRALADPDNPVQVAAALEGWCFGLSPLDLLNGRDAGLRFGISQPPDALDADAGRALGRLHEWWERSRSWPAEEVIERLLDETGLLAHAAASDLGEVRAGALLRLAAALRDASASAGGLAGLVEAVERSLAESEGGVQLRPERRDAVRVMNLHKAKGLEADVVVLAAPAGESEHEVVRHVARGGAGGGRSGFLIRNGKQVIAQPAGWDEMAAVEARYLAAEEERLRYVAATRAKRELVVARLEKTYADGHVEVGGAHWVPFEPSLQAKGVALELAAQLPEGRRPLGRSAEDILAKVAAVSSARAGAGRATATVTSVTRSSKEELAELRRDDRAWGAGTEATELRGRGRAWGRAVHRVIEGLGRGRDGDGLRAFSLAVALDEGLAASTAEAGTVVEELIAVAQRTWDAHLGPAGGAAAIRRFEWPVALTETGPDGVRTVTEGVLDTALFDGQAWRVLDWKTDEVDDAEWAGRLTGYQGQVARYAEILTRLRGEAATGTIVRTPGPSDPN